MDNLHYFKRRKTIDPLNEHGNYKVVDEYRFDFKQFREFDIDTNFIEDDGRFYSERYGVEFKSLTECDDFLKNKIRKEVSKKVTEYIEMLNKLI